MKTVQMAIFLFCGTKIKKGYFSTEKGKCTEILWNGTQFLPLSLPCYNFGVLLI